MNPLLTPLTESLLFCDGEPLLPQQLDRGLEFGDGCFETIDVSAGQLSDWPAHLERLQHAAAVLQLQCPAAESLLAALPLELKHISAGVCKIILTRGQGGLGYRVDPKAPTRLYILLTPPRRVLAPSWRVGLLTTPLMLHPTLAGLKTLNRLDAVLARVELAQHPEWDEGLMTDGRGHVISASMGNVFFELTTKQWVTPAITDCGIAGCVRRRLLERWPRAIEVRPIHVSELPQVSQAFVTNSLLPVQPISQLLDWTLSDSSGASMAKRLLTTP